MPKQLNLMPSHTHNVKNTPDVVPLIAAHAALVVAPAAVTATASALATLAVAPSAVGPPPLQHWPSPTPHQLRPCRHRGRHPCHTTPAAIPRQTTAVMFSHAMFLRTMQHSSDSEPSSEEEEFEDYFEDEGENEGEDDEDQQLAPLPDYFLGVPIFRHLNGNNASIGATESKSSARESNADGVAGGGIVAGTASNTPPPPEPTSTPSVLPWRQSKEKEQIIIELKDPSSDIHLLLGRYTAKDFKGVRFKQILIVYAGNKFKLSNFRGNMKRLLVNKLKKTRDFKEDTAEPWYTSVNKVSKGYALLFMMYMDSTKSQAVRSLLDEELWNSHP